MFYKHLKPKKKKKKKRAGKGYQEGFRYMEVFRFSFVTSHRLKSATGSRFIPIDVIQGSCNSMVS